MDQYIGLLQRLIVLLVDSTLLLFFIVFLWVSLQMPANVLGVRVDRWFAVFSLLSCWLYLTVVKASRAGTLGYILVGARIVTL